MNEQLCRARIAQNAQTREPTLDLSSLKITTLPETIGELTHLEHLDLSRNRLQQLPPELAKLTKLRTLDLNYNDEIEGLEPWIGQLSSLEELHIRELSVTELPANLARLQQLHTLDLSYTELNELPRWLGELPSLQTLNISGLNIGEIPEWFASLPIKHLVYYPSGIPNEHLIGTLTTLEALDLWSNHDALNVYPEWLQQMGHLRRLNFYSKILVPAWLMELPQLTHFESYGDFREISQVWHNWKSLEHLTCGDVAATTLPPNLKTLEITISGSAVPESIRQLHQLEELKLFGEGFRALPGWVLELPNLHTLNLVSTGIDHILPPARPNYSLRKLHMNTLYCSRQHRLDGLRSLHRLEELRLSNHRLGTLPAWLHELQQLRELSIDDCALTDLDPRLGQLQQLEELYLHGNDIPIASLERILPTLTKLKHLSFGLSSDEPFPASIRELSQLRSLYLRIGPNHVIPEWLNQLTKLESIMLGYNLEPVQIPWIEGWLALPKLREIDIHIKPELFDPELLQRFEQRGVQVDLG
ncbi:leucine-rich repeat domain-containing protein [Herpetosiphon llansteffanensis]|uniref:leucine-rich repeat domain-containing protein n=1 Tax=Herpetosiphon llansteffanensis TaxID=2094568 RepID=UPI000D7C2AE0|nr:leucine-rich repeat domain-containing protein [Herpetosiphon llansteffanensis]